MLRLRRRICAWNSVHGSLPRHTSYSPHAIHTHHETFTHFLRGHHVVRLQRSGVVGGPPDEGTPEPRSWHRERRKGEPSDPLSTREAGIDITAPLSSFVFLLLVASSQPSGLFSVVLLDEAKKSPIQFAPRGSHLVPCRHAHSPIVHACTLPRACLAQHRAPLLTLVSFPRPADGRVLRAYQFLIGPR